MSQKVRHEAHCGVCNDMTANIPQFDDLVSRRDGIRRIETCSFFS